MLEPYLSLGDGVLDIGAHVGRYTQAYAKVVGPTGCVLAVEPDASSLSRIAALGLPHVRVLQVAMGHPDWLGHTLACDADDARRNSLWAANTITPSTLGCIVNVETVDYVAPTIPRLRGIKIDAQGAEAHILDGATETLKRPDLVWAVELWPEGLRNAGRSVREVADIFSAAGYHPVASHGRTWDQLVTLIEPYTGHKSTDVVLTHRES
jgi:FkbM family methyltransferase